MNKITWVNLLHFYQPPTAPDHVIIEATEKSYRLIIRLLKNHPQIKFTFNLTGCLLERLADLKFTDVMDDLKMLYDRKQIELTGTAAYHPILPLLTENQIKNSLESNSKILKKFFGDTVQTAGFFLPELAYSQTAAKIVAAYGYRWLVLDEISALGELKKLAFDKAYIDNNSGLRIFFRQRTLSKSYVPQTVLNLIRKKFSGFALTATDAELYGLRHIDSMANLETLLKREEIQTQIVSEFLADRKETVSLAPLNSSWESTAAELKRDQPYILWKNEKNKIQKLLWQLADLAIKTLSQFPEDTNLFWAQWHLNRGLSSCTFWWASGRDFKLFSSIAWHPDEIERGAAELIRSLRSLNDLRTREIKIAAEKIYLKIIQAIWQKHWRQYWGK